MRGLVLILLSTFVMSCAVGPDYKPPEVTAPDGFRMAVAEADLKSIANL